MKNLYGWSALSFDVPYSLLTTQLLAAYISKFSAYYESNHKTMGPQVFILVTVEYESGDVKTLSKARKVGLADLPRLAKNLMNGLRIKLDVYTDEPIRQIIFKWKSVPDHMVTEKPIIHNDKNPESFNPNIIRVGEYQLPNTMDFMKWGTLKRIKGGRVVLEVRLPRPSPSDPADPVVRMEMAEFRVSRDTGSGRSIFRTKVLVNGVEVCEFSDKMENGFDNFTRTINSQSYVFRSNKIVRKMHNPLTRSISTLACEKNVSVNMITLDIETRTIDNVMTPYRICYYDGKSGYSFYLTDYSSVDAMLVACVESLLRPKYHGYKIYAHNLSMFDGIFLLRVISNVAWRLNIPLSVIKRESSLISIKLTFTGVGGHKRSIEFRDSLLTLPASLSKLAKSFQPYGPAGVVDKGVFPYLFSNTSDLEYVGRVPDLKYFDNLSVPEYNDYRKGYPAVRNGGWSLRSETIRYCILDCRVLHRVLTKFNKLIFDRFNVTIKKYPTLPSLAFGIYRSNYLGEYKVPKITGLIYNFIRKSYTGGAVDMYIPRPLPGEVVKGYDVNSLYPTSMHNYRMPTGQPIFFEVVDPSFDLDAFRLEAGCVNENGKAFGFFNCEVKAPSVRRNLDHPIIQTRVKTSEGYRTMAPLGQWGDVLFSEEIVNAEKYGYAFKVKSGYLFKPVNIFEKYVGEIYLIKENVRPSDPIRTAYFIAKLLLNSLYGKFGMAYELEDHVVIPASELDSYLNNRSNEVSDVVNLGRLTNRTERFRPAVRNGSAGSGDDLVLVSYIDGDKYDSYTRATGHNVGAEPNISIGISAAITAYSRVFMSQFKNKPYGRDFRLFYSDTDSVYVSGDFNPDHVGKGLGKFKLENTFEDIVFLAPKVYGGITRDDQLVVKIKGLTKSIRASGAITFDGLCSLLNKDVSLTFNQVKSYKSVSEGSISLIRQTYELVRTETKRELVYVDGVLSATKPYVIDNNKDITPSSKRSVADRPYGSDRMGATATDPK